jgi:DNA-binding beta-propeller fold protein YncE
MVATYVAVLAVAFATSSYALPLHNFIVPANDTSTATDGQVLAFDSRSGAFAGVVAPNQGVSQIQGLTRGPDGSIYGSYFDTKTNADGRVLRIRQDGTVETFVAPGSGGLLFPLGLTFGPDGNLYVATAVGNNVAGSVLRYDGTTGVFLDVFATTGLSVPQDLVFGPDGNLYVTNGFGDSISRFDGTTGASLGFFVPPGGFGLDAPIGLAFGPSEDLYVASFPTNTIFRFAGATGALVSAFDLPYQDGADTLLDVAFGPDRSLYAAIRQGAGGTTFVRLDPDSGAVLGQFTSLSAPLSFNTGMFFVDQACASLRSVEGQASGCFAPRPLPEPGSIALVVIGLCLLMALRTRVKRSYLPRDSSFTRCRAASAAIRMK